MADPIDGTISIDIDDKYMSARMSVTPPMNGGKEVTLEDARQAISLNGIRYNLDNEAIEQYFRDKTFDTSILIAKGTPPVDGKNGYFKYYFERKSGAQMKADEFGNIDYRDLGTIQNIHEGTVIADIFPETTGSYGRDIRGIEIPQYPGKPVKITVGNGVALSADGSQLVAAISGNLRWSKDHFIVEKEVVVSDIDLSVGNIDFIGDVTVKGNINEGFVVKSEGNISVAGNVVGATLEAKGNITGKLGFVGCTIKAEGDVKCNFGENSDIQCTGKLMAQSLVGCNVYCEGGIIVSGGKAAIVGGKYTCLSDVEANYIGSDAYIRTMIVLGNIAVLAEEKNELSKKLKEYESQLVQLDLIVNTLREQKKKAPLTPERDEMLKNSIKAKFGHMGVIKETNDRIAEIEKEMMNTNDLCVKAKKKLFPGVTVRINSTQIVVSDTKTTCTVKMGPDRNVIIA